MLKDGTLKPYDKLESIEPAETTCAIARYLISKVPDSSASYTTRASNKASYNSGIAKLWLSFRILLIGSSSSKDVRNINCLYIGKVAHHSNFRYELTQKQMEGTP